MKAHTPKTARPEPARRTRPADERPRRSFTSAESAFLAAALADGIAIQPRFRPEPLLARTGRGFMAPAGTAEMTAAKRVAHSKK